MLYGCCSGIVSFMSTNTTETKSAAVNPCGFCTTVGEHIHYTVKVYENGKFIGRLGSDGTAVTRKIFAVVLSKQKADEIAESINNEGKFTARVDKF